MISRDSSKLEKLKGFVSPSTQSNLTTLVGNVGKYLLHVFFSFFYLCNSRHFEGSLILDWLWLMKYSANLSGSEEGVEEVKQALLKSVGKITDVVSSLGFSWWQGGPPHIQPLKELQWVREQLLPLKPLYNINPNIDPFQRFFILAYMTHNISPSPFWVLTQLSSLGLLLQMIHHHLIAQNSSSLINRLLRLCFSAPLCLGKRSFPWWEMILTAPTRSSQVHHYLPSKTYI